MSGRQWLSNAVRGELERLAEATLWGRVDWTPRKVALFYTPQGLHKHVVQIAKGGWMQEQKSAKSSWLQSSDGRDTEA